jgi:hypothetical protein
LSFVLEILSSISFEPAGLILSQFGGISCMSSWATSAAQSLQLDCLLCHSNNGIRKTK